MVIRLNWYVYSVVIGFMRKEDPVTGDPVTEEPFEWGSGDPGAPGYSNTGKCGCARSGAIGRAWMQKPHGPDGRAIGNYPKGEKKRERTKASPGEGRGKSEEREGSRWRDDQLFQLAQTVITELKPCIWAAGIRKQDKQELLLSLPRFLKPYTALTVLRAYPFRIAINNFIEKETASRCLIHLNNEELLALWREVR